MLVRMPAPGPVLQLGSGPDRDHQSECSHIKEAWRRRDFSAIRTYQDFLRAHALMEAWIACSKAIASKRSVLQYPFEFGCWLEQHATSTPPPDPFGGAPHVPGLWHLYCNSNGTWGPHGGDMDITRWLTNLPRTPPPSWRVSQLPWGSASWPGPRDSNWDGVPVPKTPGKAKRRWQRLRELQERHQRELLERQHAIELGWVQCHPATLAASDFVGWEAREVTPLSEAQLTAVGWGTGQGWGAPACTNAWQLVCSHL
ncbi:hypothetical protein B0H13DRAFT_2358943 [Mycena leptocephala]|nr:hypothetical protein B0H13DRAFT_2358943 [Mycena leptocephala]